MYLPNPPSRMEKYSFFAEPSRWPFVWLFLAQLVTLGAFVAVARQSYATLFLLPFLIVLLPPTVVTFWLRMRPHRGTLEDHLSLVADWRARGGLPSVDIFLPVCGESPAVLFNTWEAVRDLEYNGVRHVWVLDDANLTWVRELAERFGFHYVARPEGRRFKKAGNLNHALAFARSQFILVLDADFAPRTDFLDESLPYFCDPRVAVVQTSQHFDTDGTEPFIARCAGLLQNLFFRTVQAGRDTYDAASCEGTNVVYRRAALQQAGGFARVPMGEDTQTGIKLRAAGWRTRYVRVNLAKGIAPSSVDAVIHQQVRWCRSAMLLMISRDFTHAPLGRRQRLCFWADFLYYMRSAALLFLIPAPVLIMLWGYPSELQGWWYLPVIVGGISILFVYPKVSPGWSPMMLRVGVLYSVCHLVAVTHAVRGVVQAWVPTGARDKEPNLPRQVRRILCGWILLVQVGVWAGLAHAGQAGVSIRPLAPVLILAVWQLVLLSPYLRARGGPADTVDAHVELTMFDLIREREAA